MAEGRRDDHFSSVEDDHAQAKRLMFDHSAGVEVTSVRSVLASVIRRYCQYSGKACEVRTARRYSSMASTTATSAAGAGVTRVRMPIPVAASQRDACPRSALS